MDTKIVDDKLLRASMQQKRSKKKLKKMYQSVDSKRWNIDTMPEANLSTRLDCYDFVKFNKSRFNSYVKGSRLSRIKEAKNKIISNKTKAMRDMIDAGQIELPDVFKDKAPFDAAFWFK
jgi:hypothetical protein